MARVDTGNNKKKKKKTFCRKIYEYTRDSTSICPSCGSYITVSRDFLRVATRGCCFRWTILGVCLLFKLYKLFKHL